MIDDEHQGYKKKEVYNQKRKCKGEKDDVGRWNEGILHGLTIKSPSVCSGQ
jgi:hypothetical protein